MCLTMKKMKIKKYNVLSKLVTLKNASTFEAENGLLAVYSSRK